MYPVHSSLINQSKLFAPKEKKEENLKQALCHMCCWILEMEARCSIPSSFSHSSIWLSLSQNARKGTCGCSFIIIVHGIWITRNQSVFDNVEVHSHHNNQVDQTRPKILYKQNVIAITIYTIIYVRYLEFILVIYMHYIHQRVFST